MLSCVGLVLVSLAISLSLSHISSSQHLSISG
jgi:hypothetical protein